MFGIVLWTNTKTGSALVWCEDQQDLAMYDGRAAKGLKTPQVAVNDQIFFELEPGGNVRRISKIIQVWGPSLQCSLPEALAPVLTLKAS